MELLPLYIRLLPKLTDTGSFEHVIGTYPLQQLAVGSRSFTVGSDGNGGDDSNGGAGGVAGTAADGDAGGDNQTGGIVYDVTFTNTGEALLLTGSARALLQGSCERCLEAADWDVHGAVEGYYLLHESATGAGGADEDAASEFDSVLADGTVDLAPALVAAIVIELPPVMLCSAGADCRGICPYCGADRNKNNCGCERADAVLSADKNVAEPDERNLDASPFAQLRDLLDATEADAMGRRNTHNTHTA
jgi:uncharacterized protein